MTAMYLIFGLAAFAFAVFLIVWPILIWSHLKKQTEYLKEIQKYSKLISISLSEPVQDRKCS